MTINPLIISTAFIEKAEQLAKDASVIDKEKGDQWMTTHGCVVSSKYTIMWKEI